MKNIFKKLWRGGRPRLLVHLCCGPCGAGAIGQLKKDYRLVLLFANSNLDTAEEFAKRFAAAKKLADVYGLRLVKSNYVHHDWLESIAGHESAPERGSRCLICYRYRMSEAAVAAKSLHCDYFTTSLTASPHKNHQAILDMGREVEKASGVKFLAFDFSADNGYQASVTEAKRLGLYRQKYCGCEYSRQFTICN